MKLETIVCSGPNEQTNIDELIALAQDYPNIEFGIQVSGKKCSKGCPRFEWIISLYERCLELNFRPNLALHINQDWVEGFSRTEVPQDLAALLGLFIMIDDKPKKFFNRAQLNFKIGREKDPDLVILERNMRLYKWIRFIVSYNDSNADFLHRLYLHSCVRFDCLYDASAGEAIMAEKYAPPAFPCVFQGYAGGLNPNNVAAELDKISQVNSATETIFIDAEGGLKGENGYFSISKCRQYVENALAWAKSHQ